MNFLVKVKLGGYPTDLYHKAISIKFIYIYIYSGITYSNFIVGVGVKDSIYVLL